MRKLAAAATALSLRVEARWPDWLLEVVMRVAAAGAGREASLEVLATAIEQVARAELVGSKRCACIRAGRAAGERADSAAARPQDVLHVVAIVDHPAPRLDPVLVPHVVVRIRGQLGPRVLRLVPQRRAALSYRAHDPVPASPPAAVQSVDRHRRMLCRGGARRALCGPVAKHLGQQ